MTAVTINQVSKRYRLGLTVSHRMLRDQLTGWLHRCWSRRTAEPPPDQGFIWALRDVSFAVEQGDAIGIIGRNGAGKSTLLKILSRVTEPTSGEIRVRGRVASLLEVGTGFHPELSGRENIYLNGAILGMRRKEIQRKFDEIVAFSEVEKFIDTPVKRYSSGMYVRLAFAVAAHLEPEILVVDEVLAVGDAAFQKKCLGKMGTVAQGGRTVLFVSHNMNAVQHLCRRGIWIDKGQVVFSGAAEEAVARYLASTAADVRERDLDRVIAALPPDPAFRLRRIALRQEGREVTDAAVNGKPLEVAITYEVLKDTSALRVYVMLCDDYDDMLLRSFHDELASEIPTMTTGTYTSTLTIPANFLGARQYRLRVQATVHNVRYCLPQPLTLVFTMAHTGLINRAYPDESFAMRLMPILAWHTEQQ